MSGAAQQTIELGGCSPVPLAHYLKGLAVLRLVSEQADGTVRGYWSGDDFVLVTNLGRDELVRFFLEEYRPTPIIAPWNKGSGFFPWDNRAAIEAISFGDAERLREYRDAVERAGHLLKDLEVLTAAQASEYRDAARRGLKKRKKELKKPISDALGERKEEIVEACRSSLSDFAVDWLDAVIVMTGDGPAYPPLLGTGGNDGRLDFTNNFMQRLEAVVDPDTGEPTGNSEMYLRGALFGSPVEGLPRDKVGQFFPAASGGFNSGSGFTGRARVNSWDYLLMIEGALLFAAASSKRLGSTGGGSMAFPFAVRSTGAGYGSASRVDESDARAEMWLPLWPRPASLREIESVMAEGRAQLGRRSARNGVDFARAVAALGVDRGIDEFQRYAFLERFGRSYIATPLERVRVRRRPEIDLLMPIDRWLNRFLSKARADNTPASVARAAHQLEENILRLAQRGGRSETLEVLVTLGDVDRAMSRSWRWSSGRSGCSPVPPLQAEWLEHADDGSVEFRLAGALASVEGFFESHKPSPYVPLRANISPVRMWPRSKEDLRGLGVRWLDDFSRDVVRSGSDLLERLNEILRRRLILATQAGHDAYSDRGRRWARLGDVAAFVDGRVDDARLSGLLRSLVLLDWPRSSPKGSKVDPDRFEVRPDASYALLKLCFSGHQVRETKVALDPSIHHRAAAGDSAATRRAAARLRASDLVPAIDRTWIGRRQLRRVAAAVLFPIGPGAVEQLTKVLRPEPSK